MDERIAKFRSYLKRKWESYHDSDLPVFVGYAGAMTDAIRELDDLFEPNTIYIVFYDFNPGKDIRINATFGTKETAEAFAEENSHLNPRIVEVRDE